MSPARRMQQAQLDSWFDGGIPGAVIAGEGQPGAGTALALVDPATGALLT